MIAILDYGLGNILAFGNIFRSLNVDHKYVSSCRELQKAKKILLPGVGSFDYAMSSLESSGMRDVLEKLVVQCDVPILGVCVGMQMMATKSDEGSKAGLGWIDGTVTKFDWEQGKLPIPHMGWNAIKPIGENGLLQGLSDGSYFYFLHSYHIRCASNESVIATSDYGVSFHSAVNQNNIYGIQCHPEKSHSAGVRLLDNFGSDRLC
jgi:glutamine amidotransferase